MSKEKQGAAGLGKEEGEEGPNEQAQSLNPSTHCAVKQEEPL